MRILFKRCYPRLFDYYWVSTLKDKHKRGASSVNSLRPSDAYMRLSDLTIIGSDNGLSPGRRQAIIRTNAGILLIRPLGTNFSEILIEILLLSFKKIRFKVSSAKRRPFCLGLNVLIIQHWFLPVNVMCGKCAINTATSGNDDFKASQYDKICCAQLGRPTLLRYAVLV